MASTGGKDGSKGFVKRVASTFSIRKKKNTESSDPKLLLPRSKSTGSSNYASMRVTQGKKALPDVTTKTKRIKSAGVSPQPRREKIDESESGKQFMKMRCFDDSDSIWLSSDCASSTSPLEDRRLSVSFHFSVDEKIVSWLSNVANSSLNLNQESTSSTKENHHHHHQTSSKNAKCSSENMRKDGKVLKSRGIGSAKPRLPESNNRTWPRKSCAPDLSPEEKKVSFSVESEKSPLPVSSSLEKVGDSKSKIVVEPLFWPFEQKFDWTPEDILKHFSMSPRRKKSVGSKSAGTSPRSMRAQLQARKPDLKEGSKRKLMFNGPIEATEDNGEMLKEAKTPKKLIMTRKSRTFLEDDFALMNDFSIENAVGLCEFKGREGIDSDFNTDGFLFYDSQMGYLGTILWK